jgi:hypothetical protein
MAEDPYHKDVPVEFTYQMMTGFGLLSYCVEDDGGPVCYVRLDADGDFLRAFIQFAPEKIVSKNRTADAIIKAVYPSMEKYGKEHGFVGLIFFSKSESLIKFTKQLGFVPNGNDDYVRWFEGKQNV